MESTFLTAVGVFDHNIRCFYDESLIKILYKIRKAIYTNQKNNEQNYKQTIQWAIPCPELGPGLVYDISSPIRPCV